MNRIPRGEREGHGGKCGMLEPPTPPARKRHELGCTAMKPKLYLETTIPSYLVSRPSRDLVMAAHQQVTRDW